MDLGLDETRWKFDLELRREIHEMLHAATLNQLMQVVSRMMSYQCYNENIRTGAGLIQKFVGIHSLLSAINGSAHTAASGSPGFDLLSSLSAYADSASKQFEAVIDQLLTRARQTESASDASAEATIDHRTDPTTDSKSNAAPVVNTSSAVRSTPQSLTRKLATRALLISPLAEMFPALSSPPADGAVAAAATAAGSAAVGTVTSIAGSGPGPEPVSILHRTLRCRLHDLVSPQLATARARRSPAVSTAASALDPLLADALPSTPHAIHPNAQTHTHTHTRALSTGFVLPSPPVLSSEPSLDAALPPLLPAMMAGVNTPPTSNTRNAGAGAVGGSISIVATANSGGSSSVTLTAPSTPVPYKVSPPPHPLQLPALHHSSSLHRSGASVPATPTGISVPINPFLDPESKSGTALAAGADSGDAASGTGLALKLIPSLAVDVSAAATGAAMHASSPAHSTLIRLQSADVGRSTATARDADLSAAAIRRREQQLQRQHSLLLVNSALSSLVAQTAIGASRPELIVLRALLLASGVRLTILSPSLSPAQSASVAPGATSSLSTDPLVAIFEFLDVRTLFGEVARVNRCWFSCVMGAEPRRSVWRRVNNLRLDLFFPAVTGADPTGPVTAAAVVTAGTVAVAPGLPDEKGVIAGTNPSVSVPVSGTFLPPNALASPLVLAPTALTIFFHKLSQLTVLELGTDITDAALASISYGADTAAAATTAAAAAAATATPGTGSAGAPTAPNTPTLPPPIDPPLQRTNTNTSSVGAGVVLPPLAAPCVLLPHLHTLSLRGCSLVTDAGINHLRLPALQHLNVSGTGISDSGLLVVVRTIRTNLRRLVLNDCANITSVGVAHIATFCTALQTLECVGCRHFDDNALRELGAGSMVGLSSLDVSECWAITNLGCRHLSNGCRNALTALNLSRCYRITDIGLSYITALCTHITDLRLAGCHGVTENGNNPNPPAAAAAAPAAATNRNNNSGLSALRQLTALTTLDLSECEFLSRDLNAPPRGSTATAATAANTANATPLWEIARACTQLTRFIAIRTNIRDSVIDALSSSLGLTYLDLTGCVSLTDAALRSLAVGARTRSTLQYIHLAGVYHVSDRGVCYLTAGCSRSLIELNVRDCVQISDQSLKAMAVSMRPPPAFVSRSEPATAVAAANDSFQRILKLKRLDVSGCHKITDDGLSHFLPPPRLRSQSTTSDPFESVTATQIAALRESILVQLFGAAKPAVPAIALAGADSKQPSVAPFALPIAAASVLPLAFVDAKPEIAAAPGTVNATADSSSTVSTAYGLGAEYGYELESLTLAGCTRLTDRGVRIISVCFPHLTRLSLYGCRLITDASIVSLLSTGSFAQRLTEFNLSGCVGLSDVTLHAIANAANGGTGTGTGTGTGRLHRTLTVLELEDCSLFSDAAMSAAIEPLTELRVLRLKGTDVNDRTLRTLVTGRCRAAPLQVLDVSSCSRLDEAVMADIRPALEKRGCRIVRSAIHSGGNGGW